LLPPLLDVYFYDSLAVKALLRGIDPYGFIYVGVPPWLVTPEASIVFPYLPGVVLFLAPFGALSDVRVGLVFADLLVALGIILMGGPKARLAAATFLWLPFTVLFSTSYPNNTLVAMAFLGLSIALWFRGRGGIPVLFLGVALASSQFLWLLYPLLLYWAHGTKRLLRTAASAIVGIAIALPFLIWDWSSFFYDTVVFEFTRVPRPILSPAALGVNVNPTLEGIAVTMFGVSVPLALRAGIVGLAMVLAVRRTRDLRSLLFNATWFMLLTILVLPNILSWWYLELPFQTFLLWLAAAEPDSSPEAANA
jgi:hypothetical protein